MALVDANRSAAPDQIHVFQRLACGHDGPVEGVTMWGHGNSPFGSFEPATAVELRIDLPQRTNFIRHEYDAGLKASNY
jgi:hypothetical protein